jgi:predicted RNase H-like nuclease
MTQVAGVDGCRKGWIAIVLEEGRFARAEFSPTFAELLIQLTDAQVIAVDIPIGLPDGSEPRAADIEARKRIGRRRSSVFPTPPRVVLEASTYFKANRISKQRFDRGISQQSYALRKKILEVDACAAADDRIYEVHPEVCFTEMNGEPLAYPKKSWHGQADRLRLLAVAGIRIPGDLGPVGATPPDDIIDAAAAAWSAHRIAAGTGEKVGKPVPDLRPNRNAGFIWY